MCVILTLAGVLLLPQQDVKVSGALGAERQQQALQYGRGAGESEQDRPHVVITQHKVQADHLHTHTPTVFGLRGCEGKWLLCVAPPHLAEEDAGDDGQLVQRPQGPSVSLGCNLTDVQRHQSRHQP